MELSDIVLTLVGITLTIMGWIFKMVIRDIKDLEKQINSCQGNLPLQYVLKDDYKDDIAEIKHMLSDMYGIIRKIKGK